MVSGSGAQPPIDFYFDFISGYGYLASLRLEAIAARHGRRIDWHCMLLGVSVMKTMGLKPLLETPLKGDYVLRDFARYQRRHGLTLARNLLDPVMDPRPAARAFCWVKRHHPGQEAPFAHALFDHYWRLGRDLSNLDELAALAPPLGLDAPALREGIGGDESRNDLRASVAASLERGVFGSPFLIVDGEPFWGSDRLEQLDEWLQCGGW
jgi:2-hydroxychromene-2-carboxylate isomerase